MVQSSIQFQATAQDFVKNVQRFPSVYGKTLYQHITELNSRVNSNYSSKGGVDPSGNFYSSIDNTELDYAFWTLQGVISYNAPGRSPNFVNTLINRIQEVHNFTKQQLQIDTVNFPTYYSTETAMTPEVVKTFAMSSIGSAMNLMTNQEQKLFMNCMQKTFIFSQVPTIDYMNNSVYPENFEFFNGGFQTLDSVKFTNIKANQYFFRNSLIPDDYCPMVGKVKNFIDSLPPKSRRLAETATTNTTSTLNLTVFNIWMERRS